MATRQVAESNKPVQVHVGPADDGPIRPLRSDERTLADEVARRLRLELRGLVDLLPEAERGASAMARALEIDRNTCQRIVAATGRGEANAAMLIQLPGIVGLRQFMDAMVRRFPAGESAAPVAGVGAAVDKFEKLIDQLAGSQRKLRERLEMDKLGDGLDSATPGPSDSLAARRSLFRTAADIVGRWSDTRLSVRIIRPVPEDPMHTENIRMTGHVGHMARAVSVPLEVYSSAPEALVEPDAAGGPAFRSLDSRQGVGDTPGFLMRKYCSQPLPRVTSRAAGARVVHAIDEMGTPGQSSDVFVADRRAGRDKHPATQQPAIGEVSLIMNYPARRLVLDVFLHRDIARRCIPSLEVHLSPLPSGNMILSRWSTKIPGGPRLELLGQGLEHATTDAYPRHVEMVSELFTDIGWDASEFVGYRCDVTYPIWRAAYCILFDFSGNELPKPIGGEDE